MKLDSNVYKAKVSYVIDGSNFEAVVDLGFHSSLKLRFLLKDSGVPNIKQDRDLAIKARKCLIHIFGGKYCTLVTESTSNLTRWLAEAYVPGVSTCQDSNVIFNGEPYVCINSILRSFKLHDYDTSAYYIEGDRNG